MTVIVFLIDTSASMNQRAYLGGRPSLLDVAKSAVEHFVKVRQRSPESRGDRYMLLTFDETPYNIKAGWKENLATFMNELKNLQCVGLTTLGTALKNAFDLLNLNRMHGGLDTYGQGRCPFYIETSIIVVITDGGKYTTMDGVPKDFTLPMHEPIPGSELTKEPFRWDQRLFSLVLRLSGTPAVDRDTGLVASDSSPIDAMCEVTGGRSYCVTSQRMMHQCIDSLVQKVQSGVVINFEKIGPEPPPISNEAAEAMDNDEEMVEEGINGFASNGITGKNSYLINSAGSMNANNLNNSTAWHSCRRLIYVPRSGQKAFPNGHWPIPESFWPDISANALPPRSAHPSVKFTCTSQEPLVIENLPFDKYELEPSPLTQYILARKQPTVCWQVFITNSYKNNEVGHPFGYLKASTSLTCVNLFVMPYNYPVLLPLLDDLFKIHRMKPTNEWRTQFTNYLRNMPGYYAVYLRRAIQRMGLQTPLAESLIPGNMDNTLSYGVLSYIKKLRNQAKVEYDRLCNEVMSRVSANKGMTNVNNNGVLEGLRVTPRDNFKKDLLSNSLDLREELNKFSGYIVGIRNHHQQRGAQSYRNAFDIPRKSLLDQVVRMRANFLQPGLRHTKLLDDDYVHSMPVSQMGNYQEYLKRMTPPLREIESTPVRQHMFGNPFKIDKRMMVDEADIDILGSTSPSRNMKRTVSGSEVGNLASSNSNRPLSKRKPGPIPREFRRLSYSPPNTPPSSPIPWAEEIRRPTSPPLPPPATENSTSMTMSTTPSVTSVIHRTLNNFNSTTNYAYSNDTATNEQKLVNGDLLTAEVFEPVLSANSLKSSGNGCAAAYSENTIANNVDAKSNCAGGNGGGVNSFGKTDVKAEPKSWLNADSSQKESGSSAIKVKCEIESTSAYTNNSGGISGVSQLNMNHIDEKHGDIKVDDVKLEKDRPLTAKEQEDVKRHNSTVRSQVFKDIRRKGHNFSSIFTHLQTIQGTLDIRLGLLRDVVKEAVRFKRQDLVQLLEDYYNKVEAQGKMTIIGPHKLHHNGAKII